MRKPVEFVFQGWINSRVENAPFEKNAPRDEADRIARVVAQKVTACAAMPARINPQQNAPVAGRSAPGQNTGEDDGTDFAGRDASTPENSTEEKR